MLFLTILMFVVQPTPQTLAPEPLQQVRVEWPLGSPTLYVEWVQENVKPEVTQFLVYRYYVDGKNPVMFRGMVCVSVDSSIHCHAPLAIKAAPGHHTITFTVAQFVSGHSVEHPTQTGPESFPSTSVEFEMK